MSGSSVDQRCLLWAEKARYWFQSDISGIEFNPGLFYLSIALLSIAAIFSFVFRKAKPDTAVVIYSALLFGIIAYSDISTIKSYREEYRADNAIINDVCALCQFFNAQSPQKTVLCVQEDNLEGIPCLPAEPVRHLDTYLNISQPFCFLSPTQLMGDVHAPCAYHLPDRHGFPQADYILLSKSNKPNFYGMRLANVDEVEVPNCDGFSLYANRDASQVVFEQNPDGVFNGSEKRIYLVEKGNNVDLFRIKGLSHVEERFTWTLGNELSVRIPTDRQYKKVTVQLNLAGTFNGNQNYSVLQGEKLILSGCINGAGTISFELVLVENEIAFTIKLHDATVVSDVLPVADDRKIALAIESIAIRTTDIQ